MGPGAPRRSYEHVHTNNADFGLMVSRLFERCQLQHHQVNWADLPRSINRNVDALFDFINPPRPDDSLRQEMTVIRNILKHDIHTAVQQHIQKQIANNTTALQNIDPTDKNKVKPIVAHKVMRQLRRIDNRDMNSWIDSGIQHVGNTRANNARTYSDVVRGSVGQTQTLVVATNPTTAHTQTPHAQAPFTTVRRSKRVLPHSPPSPIAVSISNRFEVLHEEEVVGAVNPTKVRRVANPDAEVAAVGGAGPRVIDVVDTDVMTNVDTDVSVTSVVTGVMETCADSRMVETSVDAGASETNVASVACDMTATSVVCDACDLDVCHGDVSVALCNRVEGLSSSQPLLPSSTQRTMSSFFSGTQGGVRGKGAGESLRPSLSQPTKNGLGNSIPRQGGRVILHENQKKVQWSLQSRARVVIVADSNFRLCQCLDSDYEVHVFPGANLSHASRILNSAVFSDTTQHVVIAIGINHRDWEFDVSTMPELRKTTNQADKMTQKVHFLGVSVATLPTARGMDNTRKLNAAAKEKFGRHFIAPIPPGQVSINPGDSYGIHHDAETVGRIFSSIVKHVSAFSLN